ncbi:hypothetical protein CIT292_09066 [Citrobacter youngae ATCC 29220]|uniref:Uncharacterized protein n=1 Tax=Citrobacter youngae ATCC 29220 TaxID=500640 RepID=D4BFP6_9ENTR|nr:hypothetical protein CIT292_09066 [Citrobacter youngae ATCC 29220]
MMFVILPAFVTSTRDIPIVYVSSRFVISCRDKVLPDAAWLICCPLLYIR